METWDDFKCAIKKWSRLEIDDTEFYQYLITSEFNPIDQRLVDVFILQHDGGEWTHAIYHRM